MSIKIFTFYTSPTPNGKKVSMYLEELEAVDGSKVDYEVRKIDMSKNEQKEDWFIRINPNGKIPALVDHPRVDFHYDTENKLSFNPVNRLKDYSEAPQWIFFAHGGVGPMPGQGYGDETMRLYSVIELRLTDRDYLADPDRGQNSIADANVFPWILAHKFIGIESVDEFANFKKWIDRVHERAAVKAGLEIPA
ncbi:hypothetical protein CONPUDRAFT_91769 [Coniophora puteana RWD-64-598 SS2]|uniref:Glutathione S-transferase n=1 Tax=Coniophora puteana (strain RWD-64-598) TaxID=741705 RepID=A0A5M3MGB8_CONPW|nr:uncharacterized protein CONPUDRAFT_91769 [Coniophora puteana RWD-64-598 SS2]EIW78289.1 hypothetical protein CONPUDRAFT_91769 [Coniophora puteana RWD-64-598 SS2]